MGLTDSKWLLFALAAALWWPAADAEPTAAPSSVRDLVYGEILFDFFQADYLAAITRHLVAVERGTLVFHAAEAELLSGGMYLAYGQQRQAEEIFVRLLDSHGDPQVRQQARLELARSHYRRGSLERAAQLLAASEWDPVVRDEARALAAGSLLGLGRYGEAEALLRELERSPDGAFARYNLGVALAGQGELDEAVRQLRLVGNLPAPRRRGLFFRRPAEADGALPALRDRARLALGYTLIRHGAPDEALRTLEGVDLDGPYASASLLGAGWAAAEMERFDLALNAWRALQQRDPADPAVQEAWFAVPYALGELAAHGQAAAAFADSIAAIETEDHALTEAIDTLRSQGIAALLLADDAAAGWDAGWRLQEAPDHPLSRYLFDLMADNVFQQRLRDYRDLRDLLDLLERRRGDFAAYRGMIEARRQRFEQHAPLARSIADGSRLAALEERAAVLRDRVETVDVANDYLALASSTERAQLDRLDRVAQSIDRLPAGPADDLRDRQRLLHGLLRWRLSSDYAARRHALGRELQSVENDIALAQRRRQQLVDALQSAPAANAGFAQRLDAMLPRIATTQARLVATLENTDRRLVELATDELQQRRARLAQYLDQARFALAAIHDRAAAEGS